MICLKWVIPIALLTLPWWLGYPLFRFGFDTGLVLLYMGLLLNPYGNWHPSFESVWLIGGWIPTIMHWCVVLLLYISISRGRSLLLSLAIFIGLAIFSVITVHEVFTKLGYEYHFDVL